MNKHIRSYFLAMLAVAACITVATSSAAQTTQTGGDDQAVKRVRLLTLEDAQRIADAAASRADQNEWTVAIAILDAGGHLLYFQRMDGTQIGSGDLAISKAESSLMFKRPTKAFEDMVLKNGMVHLLNLAHVIAVEGGLPILHEGHVIGAIGISGVTAAQDGIIAAAGLATFR